MVSTCDQIADTALDCIESWRKQSSIRSALELCSSLKKIGPATYAAFASRDRVCGGMIHSVATMDPQRERGRLSEIYAGKTDEELQQVDTQSDELTDIAQDVLREELARRGLPQNFEQPNEAGQNELEFRDLVTIRAFWGLLEAQLAKGLLDSAGIESFLFDDNMVRMDWFNANALGGVKLRVDAHNVDAANRVLQEVSDEVEPEEPESLA